jgi:Arc/MetJ-type ribon-helix-helix transcriptional regulator
MAVASPESETLQLILEVPFAVAQHIRQQVSAGMYSNENDYVQSILASSTFFEPIEEGELVHWMNTEGVRRIEGLEENPSSALTLDEAFAGLIGDEEGG